MRSTVYWCATALLVDTSTGHRPQQNTTHAPRSHHRDILKPPNMKGCVNTRPGTQGRSTRQTQYIFNPPGAQVVRVVGV